MLSIRRVPGVQSSNATAHRASVSYAAASSVRGTGLHGARACLAQPWARRRLRTGCAPGAAATHRRSARRHPAAQASARPVAPAVVSVTVKIVILLYNGNHRRTACICCIGPRPCAYMERDSLSAQGMNSVEVPLAARVAHCKRQQSK